VYAQSTFDNGAIVFVATCAFTFQVYCDFAGYSNIARGLAKCMGIDLIINFRTPLFATNPQDFWQRWHISLTSWLKDYLFTPLCLIGSIPGKFKIYFSAFLTMLICGLWHGAGWHFILYGAYHGLLLVFYRSIGTKIAKRLKLRENSPIKFINSLKKLIGIVLFFLVISIGMAIFRVQTVGQLFKMANVIITHFQWSTESVRISFQALFFIAPVLFIDIFERKYNDINFIFHWKTFHRTLVYTILILLLIGGGALRGREFIYFQF